MKRKKINTGTKKKIGMLFGSLLLALLISAIIMILLGYSPVQAYSAMFAGAFGGANNLATTLGTATPLIFAGLAMAISDKAGVFNIGGEGQIIIGAMAAAVVGQYGAGLPAVIHIILCLLAASVAGGIWAGIAAVLKVRMNINEVIVTIMLNYLALYFVDFLVMNPFKAEGMTARTDYVADSAMIPTIVRNTRLNCGLLIAVAIAVVTWIILKYTVSGYELRTTGLNPRAAENAGISTARSIYGAMFLSGAVAALGGAVEVLGVHHYYISGMTENYGYDGIAVAVMGGNNPIGTVLAAIVFGALKAGASNMNRMTDIPADFISIVQALVIIFVATPAIVEWIIKPAYRKIAARKAVDRG